MSETQFVLPTKSIEQEESDPQDIVIVSIPKSGKTEICAQLTNEVEGKGFLFCVEKGGTDHLRKGLFVNIWKDPTDPDRVLTIEEAMENYIGYRDALTANRGQYKYLIIDNMSDLYTLAEIFGTYRYMHKVPAGKNFNRDAKGNEYDYRDDRFKLVSTLAEGYGYRHINDWFTDQMNIFSEIAPYRIYLAHVKDKMLKNNNSVEEVKGTEISLTGKLKDAVARRVATMCKLIVEGDKRFLSFEVDSNNIIAGSRASQLQGKVLISDKQKDGSIKTFWTNVYKNLEK